MTMRVVALCCVVGWLGSQLAVAWHDLYVGMATLLVVGAIAILFVIAAHCLIQRTAQQYAASEVTVHLVAAVLLISGYLQVINPAE